MVKGIFSHIMVFDEILRVGKECPRISRRKSITNFGLVAICRRSRTFPSGRTEGGIHIPLQILRSLLRAQSRLAARRVSTHARKPRNDSICQLAIRVRFGWLAFSYCRTNVCGEQIAQASTSTDIALAAVHAHSTSFRGRSCAESIGY